MASEYVWLTDEFKAIPGFEGYYAKRDGSLWSAWQKGPVKGMKSGAASRLGSRLRKLYGKKHASGHMEVKLKDHVMRKWHHMVLFAFVGPRPDGMECRHLNGIPDDNRLENICWGTRKENAGDTVRHGRVPRGPRPGKSQRIAEVRRLLADGWSKIRIAKFLHMHPKTITRIQSAA